MESVRRTAGRLSVSFPKHRLQEQDFSSKRRRSVRSHRPSDRFVTHDFSVQEVFVWMSSTKPGRRCLVIPGKVEFKAFS